MILIRLITLIILHFLLIINNLHYPINIVNQIIIKADAI